MDTEMPIEELDRQQVHDESALNSNSDDDQLDINYNPAPTDNTVNHLLNATTNGFEIIQEDGDHLVPSATTNSAEGGHNITQVEASSSMPEENATQQEVHDVQHGSSSNLDNDQFETSNPAVTKYEANHFINGAADNSTIIPINSDLPLPSVATDSSSTPTHLETPITPTEDGHNITDVEATNLMSDENAMNVAMVYERHMEESVGDEHDERDLVVPTAL